MSKLAAKKPTTRPRKRTGRPSKKQYALDDRRHIPLDLSHADVQALDAEAAERNVSRAELCRQRLRADVWPPVKMVFSERAGGFVPEDEL